MANPFNADAGDARLVEKTLWSPEVMLSLMRRDWGMIERPFHCAVAELTRTTSSTTHGAFGGGSGLAVTFPASMAFADTGVSLKWRIGLFLEIRTGTAGEDVKVRVTASNATNHQEGTTGNDSYTEIETWCEGTTWPPTSLSLQGARLDAGSSITVYCKRDWADNAADCYFQIDEV